MVLALDEAHNVRNLKKAYRAAHALGERAALTIAMTATPGVGKPSVNTTLFLLNTSSLIYLLYRTCGTWGDVCAWRSSVQTRTMNLTRWRVGFGLLNP